MINMLSLRMPLPSFCYNPVHHIPFIIKDELRFKLCKYKIILQLFFNRLHYTSFFLHRKFKDNSSKGSNLITYHLFE